MLYSTHAINFIFGYLFILICTNYLGEENRFQFTGFVSLLNIILIPISCLSISLSGLYKNGKKNIQNYSMIYSKSLIILVIFLLIFSILNFFFELNKFIQIEIKNFPYIAFLIFIALLYSLENAENLAKQKFTNYSIINSLPFLIRIVLIFLLFVILKYESFKLVLIVYILSFSFLLKKYFIRFYLFGSFKNIFIFKKLKKFNFLKNLLTISIFSLIINIDVIASRYVEPLNSTNYYIESLFGKIIFFLSTIAVLFMYPTNVQGSKNNFYNILFLNFTASVFLILFYYFFFDKFYLILFPDMILNKNIVILISISCLLLSISNIASYKLNIFGIIYHSLIKLILTIILIAFLFNSQNISELIFYLLVFSFSFLLIDLFFYVNFQKKII